MAKKSNNNKLFDAVQDNVSETADSILNSADTAMAVGADDAVEKMMSENPALPKTTSEKLEDLEKYEAENKRLFQENSELNDKIAEYLEQIDQLKSISTSNAELDVANALIAKLQAESDQYLIKISELTFDNARLQASLNNVTSNSTANSTSPNIIRPQHTQSIPATSRPVRYPYPINGYDAWN